MSTENEPMIDGKALSDLKVVDLKNELEKRGLPTKGVKKELVDRLREHIEQTEGGSTQQEVAFNAKMGESPFLVLPPRWKAKSLHRIAQR